ncbi:MAG: rhamnulokinase [Clostridia bacterium]|nr:rhamnulokinase [Clostridia bacterium]
MGGVARRNEEVKEMYHLAIDIGASSGRHILGRLKEGRLESEEIYRFENGIHQLDGTLTWDVDHLVQHIKKGIARCAELGKIPATVAIDTWGVDYVLLDGQEQEILPVVAYRDGRTDAGAAEVAKILPQEELYARTGIQKQNFNTIYQLWCDKQSGKLDTAAHFLMMPDYLSYKLTGVMKNEYTNATTANLVNAESKEWDTAILERLGIPAHIFLPLALPTTVVGEFTPAVQAEVGFNATVILCPSHDTASAVAAIPLEEDCAYISSGTWSLIGTENTYPVTGPAAMAANLTNEGGIEYRFRFLKNIMGMWLFQNIRKELGKQYTYDEMMKMAMSSDYEGLIDPTDDAFMAPQSMLGAIRTYLGEPELPLGDVLACVYHSLAASYERSIREIEQISGKKIGAIHIVGGGSKDAYLNRLTAKQTGCKVYVGLTEATATGNLLSQVMYSEKISLAAAREIVKETFKISEVTV